MTPPNPKAIHGLIQRSEDAFKEWRVLPAPKRAELFFVCAEKIKSKRSLLIRQIVLETGKTLTEARAEVQELLDTVYYYAGEGRRLYGITTPSELPLKTCHTVRRPLGVCLVVSPWNFPLAVAGWKIFAALILGNSVVWKPSEKTGGCARLLRRVLSESGFPKEIVQLIEGKPGEWFEEVLSHPLIRVVSFTGSTESGRRIASQCSALGKRFALELGGKNAQMIFEDADLGLAVKGAVWGAFASAGQRCTSTSRLLVQKSVLNRVVRRLKKEIHSIRIGSPMDPETQVGPLISREAALRVDRMVQKALLDGARLAAGGKPLKWPGNARERGRYYLPTLLTGVTPEMDIFQREVFGPVLSVTAFRDADEAVALANHSAYGLSSSVYTQSLTTIYRVIDELDTGITYINGPTIGAEAHLPFGGTKDSGSGHREAGREGLDVFSEWKTVYLDCSGRLQKAQMTLEPHA